MDRHTISDELLSLATAIERLPLRVRRAYRRAAAALEVLPYRVTEPLRTLAGWVRGCGCTDDYPESCEQRAKTDLQYGTWCCCACHSENRQIERIETAKRDEVH